MDVKIWESIILKYMMIEAQTNGKLKSRDTNLKWVIEIVKEDWYGYVLFPLSSG